MILVKNLTIERSNKKIFENINFTIKKMRTISKKVSFSKIAAIESRGFIFASVLSFLSGKPLVLLRKKGKLPGKTYSEKFKLEYGFDILEIHKSSLKKNDKVLIIDDLIATGGTAEAASKLIEISKGRVEAFIFVINLFDLGGSDKLIKKGFKVENLIEFPGH